MRRALQAAALVLFGLLVALVLVEVAFHVAGVGGPADLDPTYDRPSNAFVPHGDRQNPWSRGVEAPLRVAVIGDSFTTGYANQWYDGYPMRLEQLLNLNAGSVPVEVRAFARNGTPTSGQLGLLEQAIEYGADVVVLGLFINDTEDLGDPDLDRRRQLMLPRVPTGWTRSLLRSSRALAWIYLRFEDMRRYRAALDYQEYVLDPRYSGWKKFRQAIRAFAAASHEHDFKLVAVIWPSMGGLGPRYPHRPAHERMAHVLERLDIPYLDLLPEFEDKSSVRLSAYPEIDVHPNEVGHRLGASAIFGFLLESGAIDASYAPRRSRVAGEGHFRQAVKRRRSPAFYP